MKATSAAYVAYFVFFQLLCQQVFAQGQDGYAAIVERVTPSIVLVSTYDSSGKQTGRGTGFCVAKNSFITNYHVIEGAARITIRTASNRTYSVLPNSIVEDSDLALLKTTVDVDINPLSFASTLPKPGERIVVVGNPLGLTGTVSDGIVSAIRDEDDLVQITAPISPGSSGSPVFDLKGAVVGIATLNLKGGQNLNFAVSSRRAQSLWPNAFKIDHSISTKSKLSLSARWRMINDEDTVYDKDTLSKAGDIVSVWIRFPEKGGNHVKVLYEINCTSRQLRAVQSSVYGDDGTVLSNANAPSAWSVIIPGSNGEGYFDVFCKGKPDLQSENDLSELWSSSRALKEKKDFRAAADSYWKAVHLAYKLDKKLESFLMLGNLEIIYKELNDVPALEKLYKFMGSKGYVSSYHSLAVLYRENRMLAKFRSAVATGIRVIESKASKKDATSDDLMNLADLYKIQGQKQKALTALKRGYALSPHDAFLISELGSLYIDLKRPRDCITLIQKALDDSDIKSHNRGLLLVTIKMAYQELGDHANVNRVDEELKSLDGEPNILDLEE